MFVRYTEKFFNFSKVFKEDGAIKPDIIIPLKVEDLENKSDATLNCALEYIKKEYVNSKEMPPKEK